MEKTARPRLTRRGLLRATAQVMAGYALLGVGVGVYGLRLEPDWLKIERIRVPIRGLPPAFDGFRIAQLSDIHLSVSTRRETIAHAIRMALDLAPDVIVLTGDYVTDVLDANGLYAEMSPLAAHDSVFFILGNHDHWVDPSGVRQVMADAGIPELRNASRSLTRDGETIWLVGVDDIWEKHHDLPLALADVPPDGTAMLLAHEPDYADESAQSGRVALQLSGHSHGGQVRIPFVGAPFLPYLGRKYPYGLRRVGEMWLYTNRGVGMITPAVRINCRPEVTEVMLRRAEA